MNNCILRFFYMFISFAMIFFSACEKAGDSPFSPISIFAFLNQAKFEDITVESGEEIIFTAEATGGKKPYTFSWKIDGRQFSSNESTEPFIISCEGKYKISLTVTDSDDESNTIERTVIVKGKPLTAKIKDSTGVVSSTIKTVEGMDIVLSADIQGGCPPYTLEWDFGGLAPSSSLISPEILKAPAAGKPFNCRIKLSVKDSRDKKVEADVNLNVDNRKPISPTGSLIVRPQPDEITIFTGGYVYFEAANLSGNEPISYSWDFGNGSEGLTGRIPGNEGGKIRFTKKGKYTVTLKVNDLDGDAAVDYATVNVLEATPVLKPVNINDNIPFNTGENGSLFDWNTVEGASGYRLEISESSDFTNPLLAFQINGQNSSTTLYYNEAGKLNSGMMYWWRVFAVDAYGNISSASNIRSFTYNLVNTRWKIVSPGPMHVLAIREDGTLWGWGSNYFGQVYGTPGGAFSTPKLISSRRVWEYVSAGNGCSYAIRNDGALVAWGRAEPITGTAGSNIIWNEDNPVMIGSGIKWDSISSGSSNHTLGIDLDGNLYSWGKGADGELGRGKDISSVDGTKTPFSPMNASKWKRVYTGGGCSFAIDDCSRLSAWGKNSSYELGLGDNINRYVPEQVGNGRWLMISSAQGYGFNTTFGLDANHRIFAWGRSGYNTCRFCDIEDMPVESEGSSEFKTPTYLALSNIENSQWQEIAATSSNTIYARKASGELWAWGKGGYYGDEKESSCEPRRINIIDIDLILAAGNARFAFSAGRLFVWGGNQYSLLGLGISESYSISYSAPVGAD